MDENLAIDSKEARKRLLSAYTVRDPGGFGEFVKRPLLNPVEQRDDKNRRKPHPLFVVGAFLIVVAAAAFFFFQHGGFHVR